MMGVLAKRREVKAHRSRARLRSYEGAPIKKPLIRLVRKDIDMQAISKKFISLAVLLFISCWVFAAEAQTPPSETEISRYTGILAAASKGDNIEINALIVKGENPNVRDNYGRTPLHVAVFRAHHGAIRALAAAGADLNALENDRYDIITIAAVQNDVPTLKLALKLGASAKNITSPYDGTALIAAAHLGHVEVVKILIEAGAPLDHINTAGWTALIESIVLGDGGPRHTNTLKALVDAGANVNIADRNGQTPYALAHSRGFKKMMSILKAAGAR